MTARDKCPLRNRDNLTQPIQMQLSQIEEVLSNFFSILKSILYFKSFPKKEDPHS